jgi:hypothetical protein
MLYPSELQPHFLSLTLYPELYPRLYPTSPNISKK